MNPNPYKCPNLPKLTVTEIALKPLPALTYRAHPRAGARDGTVSLPQADFAAVSSWLAGAKIVQTVTCGQHIGYNECRHPSGHLIAS